MTEPPSYPKTDRDQAQHDAPMGNRSRSHAVLIFVIIGAIFVLMLVLHIAGVVGPGTNM